MHFGHISAKIQLKNLKQHLDWEAEPPGPPLATPLVHRLQWLIWEYLSSLSNLSHSQNDIIMTSIENRRQIDGKLKKNRSNFDTIG